jgi:hypothetical protein
MQDETGSRAFTPFGRELLSLLVQRKVTKETHSVLAPDALRATGAQVRQKFL